MASINSDPYTRRSGFTLLLYSWYCFKSYSNFFQWLNEEQLIEKVINLFAVEKPPAPPEATADTSAETAADTTQEVGQIEAGSHYVGSKFL